MKFTTRFSKRRTAQIRPIPGSGQVPNSAGGHSWAIDPWKLLDRFLILGTEGGTYYASEPALTVAQAQNALDLAKTEGLRLVQRTAEVSKSGRAPKNDPAIFALALASAFGETETRQAAFAALPTVCRTGTHLFQFVAEAEQLRGWGRGMRKAIANWYVKSDPEDLTYQALKYQQRGGWSHRDLLRLSHPKPPSEAHRVLFKWIVDDEIVGQNGRIEAFERLKATVDPKAAAAIVRESKLTRECVPTTLLTKPEVWEALLEDMPVTAMVRNLANMTRCGLLSPGSRATKAVTERLGNETLIRRARLHPLALLVAHATYAQGRGFRGSGEWEPVPRIVDALDEAFVLAFGSVEPTEKRYVLGIDVSGSMSSATVAGSSLSACEAATAMAMVTLTAEQSCHPMAFANGFKRLPLSPKMRLADALKHTRNVNFGGTDCALPMIWAQRNKVEADVFIVYTDSETWFGKVHPVQALEDYRQKTGIGAKLIVVGMCANRFTIADPHDPGMLDVVGFDTAVPQAMHEFALQ
ncbi:MAG: TROVE domain-containing protein [Armatimonadetes bacterium]|nr:TROVE domain-containing protein [Armatimonadota bacterium]